MTNSKANAEIGLLNEMERAHYDALRTPQARAGFLRVARKLREQRAATLRAITQNRDTVVRLGAMFAERCADVVGQVDTLVGPASGYHQDLAYEVEHLAETLTRWSREDDWIEDEGGDE